jgi:hypothetical protein
MPMRYAIRYAMQTNTLRERLGNTHRNRTVLWLLYKNGTITSVPEKPEAAGKVNNVPEVTPTITIVLEEIGTLTSVQEIGTMTSIK